MKKNLMAMTVVLVTMVLMLGTGCATNGTWKQYGRGEGGNKIVAAEVGGEIPQMEKVVMVEGVKNYRDNSDGYRQVIIWRSADDLDTARLLRTTNYRIVQEDGFQPGYYRISKSLEGPGWVLGRLPEAH